MQDSLAPNRRILIVDDNEAIHQDFRKILTVAESAGSANLASAKAALFGAPEKSDRTRVDFELESAFQGQEALQKIVEAQRAGKPFAMAFVDMRMPPGWDGVETIRRVWEVDPEVQIVICTAYSDYSWGEIIDQFGQKDNLLILKKPFDNVEVSQLATALTDKWRLTRQAQLKMESLTEMVAARTAELEDEIAEREEAQRLLQEKEKLIRRSLRLESIGKLAGGIAHEFNNLLQVIQGYTAFALESLTAEDPVRADLDRSLTAAQKAAVLANHLLTFSRGNKASLVPTQLNDIVTEYTDLLKSTKPSNVDLVISLDENIGQVLADDDLVNRMLTNLCLNAIDAMPEGGMLTITTKDEWLTEDYCEFHPGAEAGRSVLISVTDTGCGMTAETIEKIFNPFYTTKEVGSGTGLGLTTVYGIVQQLAGTITVYSEPGEGTTFRVRLPTTDTDHAPYRIEADLFDIDARNRLILVVDDEANCRDVTVRILEQAGYRTMVASDGEEGVELFARHADEIDMIVLDIVMPGFNGHQTLERIQELRPHTPTIFCTGFDPVAFAGQKTTTIPVIAKPVNPELLVRTVHDSLASATLV